MPWSDTHERWMQRALILAENAVGLSEPNPRVGCVLLSPSGEVLAEGFTQLAGGPHAEAAALRALHAAGGSARGATAYVTLEPCSHHGRTPPCADALLDAGVAQVVVACPDPNPLVAGQGLARLRAAGVHVELLPAGHPLAQAAHELNMGFMSRMQRQRPWVRMKAAISLDGRTALDSGDSQWITGSPARHDGHVWRRRAGAILCGSGTVLADDPQLNVRGVPTMVQPAKVVLDSRWRLPLEAALWGGDARVWVYGLAPADGVQGARMAALQARGAQAIEAPAGADGRPDLAWVLADLARRGINELHVEAGAGLNASLIEGGWVDELLVYLAPKLLGPGKPMADLLALPAVSQAHLWRWHAVTPVGEDLRLVLRRP